MRLRPAAEQRLAADSRRAFDPGIVLDPNVARRLRLKPGVRQTHNRGENLEGVSVRAASGERSTLTTCEFSRAATSTGHGSRSSGLHRQRHQPGLRDGYWGIQAVRDVPGSSARDVMTVDEGRVHRSRCAGPSPARVGPGGHGSGLLGGNHGRATGWGLQTCEPRRTKR